MGSTNGCGVRCVLNVSACMAVGHRPRSQTEPGAKQTAGGPSDTEHNPTAVRSGVCRMRMLAWRLGTGSQQQLLMAPRSQTQYGLDQRLWGQICFECGCIYGGRAQDLSSSFQFYREA